VHRLRSCFVGAQAAASILLLVVAALLVRAEHHVTHREFGFAVDRLMGVSPGFARGQYDAGRAAQYWTAALARVKSLPGVEAAALVEHPPFGGSTRTSSQARGGLPFVVHFNRTSEDFFRTAGIHIFSGRPYTAAEVARGAPVAVVSRSLAREFWRDDDPLGSTLKRVSEKLSGVQVIGVASDAQSSHLTDAISPTVYQPLSGDQRVATLLIQGRTDPASLVQPVRESLLAIDPALVPRPWLVRDGLSLQLQRAEALSALGVIAGLLARPWGRERAWAFVQSQWDVLVAKLGTFQGIPGVVSALGTFCSAAAAADITRFFDAHPVASSNRAVKQTIERIEACVALDQRQSPAFASWLGQP
jgi:hypothetical protein